jgi:lysophospholipase L1-like esterase
MDERRATRLRRASGDLAVGIVVAAALVLTGLEPAAAATLGLLAVAAGLTGGTSWLTLVLLPIGLFTVRFGVGPGATAAVGVLAAVATRGRQGPLPGGLAPLVAVLAIVGAAALVWRQNDGVSRVASPSVAPAAPPVGAPHTSRPNPPALPPPVAAAARAAFQPSSLHEKVSAIVIRAHTKRRRPDGDERPELATLGSSSSGDTTLAGSWPELLQQKRPDLWVNNLAYGGATTWHMAEALDRLDRRPAACVVYLGHNDTNVALPGGTILQLLGGTPVSSRMSPPVGLDELPQIMGRITARCGATLAISEYVRGRDEFLAPWGKVVAAVPGVRFAEGATALGPERDRLIVDDVHPSHEGHARFADFVDTTLRELLPPGATRPSGG